MIKNRWKSPITAILAVLFLGTGAQAQNESRNRPERASERANDDRRRASQDNIDEAIDTLWENVERLNAKDAEDVIELGKELQRNMNERSRGRRSRRRQNERVQYARSNDVFYHNKKWDFTLDGTMSYMKSRETEIYLGGSIQSVPLAIVHQDKLYIFALGDGKLFCYQIYGEKGWTCPGGGLNQFNEISSDGQKLSILGLGWDNNLYRGDISGTWTRL
jgi:hypothetical protein